MVQYLKLLNTRSKRTAIINMIELDDLTFAELFWLLFAVCVGVFFLCNYTAMNGGI